MPSCSGSGRASQCLPSQGAYRPGALAGGHIASLYSVNGLNRLSPSRFGTRFPSRRSPIIWPGSEDAYFLFTVRFSTPSLRAQQHEPEEGLLRRSLSWFTRWRPVCWSTPGICWRTGLCRAPASPSRDLLLQDESGREVDFHRPLRSRQRCSSRSVTLSPSRSAKTRTTALEEAMAELASAPAPS